MSKVSNLNMSRKPTNDKGYAPKRSKATGVVIILVVALISLFGYVGQDHFIPATEVEITRAQVIKGSSTVIQQGQLAFQSAGWLEPAPFPTRASALVSGVVSSIHVLDGDSVSKGDLIAQLNNEDIKLDIAENTALKNQAEQQLQEIEAEFKVAVAKSALHKAKIETAQRTLSKLKELAEILEGSGSAIPKLDRITARHNVQIQQATLDEALAQTAVLKNAEQVVSAKISAQKSKLKLILNTQAKLELALERTRIVSPIDGVIKRLYVLNGSIINLGSDSSSGAIVAELYEPHKMQVKVDVPLSDAAGLSVGQKAKVTVELLPEKEFEGTVSSIAGRADITRNTLQAKVKLINPDPKLRPEMLAKVKFLSLGKKEVGSSEPGTSVSTFIPQSAVSNNMVWVVDRISSKASKIPVQCGQAVKEGWINVISGIQPGQQLITSDTSGLKEGMRVKTQEN